MIDQPTTLETILYAKEERAWKQKELLSRHPLASLISLTINIPSLIKLSHEAVVAHEIAHQALLEMLQEEGIELLACESKLSPSGAESFFTCKVDAKVLKAFTCKVEMTHPLGRLMDIDVLDLTGNILSRSALGLPKRRCFACEEEAQLCARSQRHTYAELNLYIKQLVEKHAFAHSIALWCERAMQTEVELTPKPGLVDQANSGAHHDMDIHTFYTSIRAIKPFVIQWIQTAQTYAHEDAKQSFVRLRKIGIACEKAMFEATSNVNTHKGMIFCLAVFCGAIGRLKGCNQSFTCKRLQTQMQALCANLVEDDLLHVKPNSAGARFFYETGSSGIRGIAQSGFDIIFESALPFFQACKKEEGEEIALKKTLLLLMSRLDDSTLWSRGGVEGLAYAKTQTQALLHVKPNAENLDTFLRELDADMISKNLSPGGSADLLAMTWLLSHIVKEC
ncbi:triphosphoribosyl-dephospho-CoA synthase CitG [Sulfurospirillum diekertiae]|uniref:Probable 2-(5''-triphosphoribosyl)-3'-dephosphocoenzyme-A synthase n=1 Tax=Sulfurospirillum diekertiae TaxID=1854492 RepID=A0A1Y0HMH0_9BACT|nr:triphosphoribosyl-dephospho-CoA synthase CitG [Sulfurospirillum diekertiae]ARU49319.1 2-(5''-triphosphoribosyl)-3'-dephosphocoenzyme-A synthase [Sulfurospirillum diekertiae]ASC94128.1 2-(5''-triphosphoribosyl)-3'-dephosphocoenzyme-A synthase [Sulfurospirillum diekertiae]